MKNKVRVPALIVLCCMLFCTLCGSIGCRKPEERFYTVSFNTDGGTAVSSVTVAENGKIGTLPTTSKTGYRFRGWSDTKGGAVNVDEQYIVTRDITLFAVFQAESGGETVQEETCTITYATSGTLVNSATVKKGEAIGSMPFTDRRGYSFLGWFYDKELKDRVYAEDIITQDVTLYAGFEAQDVDSVLPEYTELSIGSGDVNYELCFASDEVIDERNLSSFLSVTALYGEVPKLAVNKNADGSYVLSPIGGYRNGGVYQISAIDDRVSFVGLDAAHGEDYLGDGRIRTVYLSVDAGEEELVAVRSGVYEMKRSAVAFSESGDSFFATEAVSEKLPFGVDSVVCVTGDDAEDACYIKITAVRALDGGCEYSFVDCESVDDVYEDFNLNTGDVSVINDLTLPENQALTNEILSLLASELYGSRGTEALTGMLASALNASPTLRAVTYAASENPYRDNISDVTGKSFTVKGLLEDLEIKVSLGSAKNTSFDGIAISPFDDTRWTMLQITFQYETEIKNNVRLKPRSPSRSTCMSGLLPVPTSPRAISKPK